MRFQMRLTASSEVTIVTAATGPAVGGWSGIALSFRNEMIERFKVESARWVLGDELSHSGAGACGNSERPTARRFRGRGVRAGRTWGV